MIWDGSQQKEYRNTVPWDPVESIRWSGCSCVGGALPCRFKANIWKHDVACCNSEFRSDDAFIYFVLFSLLHTLLAFAFFASSRFDVLRITVNLIHFICRTPGTFARFDWLDSPKWPNRKKSDFLRKLRQKKHVKISSKHTQASDAWPRPFAMTLVIAFGSNGS